MLLPFFSLCIEAHQKAETMKLSKVALNVLARFHTDLELQTDADGNPIRGFDIMTIITVITQLLPLFANCKKKPPVPTPVPTPVVALGVTAESWKDASDAKWHAEEAYTGRGKFSYKKTVVKAAARQIVEERGVSMDEATALALASLERSRLETVSDLAITIHTAKAAA